MFQLSQSRRTSSARMVIVSGPTSGKIFNLIIGAVTFVWWRWTITSDDSLCTRSKPNENAKKMSWALRPTLTGAKIYFVSNKFTVRDAGRAQNHICVFKEKCINSIGSCSILSPVSRTHSFIRRPPTFVLIKIIIIIILWVSRCHMCAPFSLRTQHLNCDRNAYIEHILLEHFIQAFRIHDFCKHVRSERTGDGGAWGTNVRSSISTKRPKFRTL